MRILIELSNDLEVSANVEAVPRVGDRLMLYLNKRYSVWAKVAEVRHVFFAKGPDTVADVIVHAEILE